MQDSPSAVDRDIAAAALNRLIGRCKTDAAVLEAAASIVGAAAPHDRLVTLCQRRTALVHELSETVRALGHSPRAASSPFENIRSIFRYVRAAVIGDHQGDAYAVCARVEAKTEAAYATALLDPHLPAEARSILERQHTEIEADRDELTRLRSLQ